MNETKTVSMLQRIPVILAVTAASYGLNTSQAQGAQAGNSKAGTQISASGKPSR
ncbi:MAG: hypothetical protein HYX47_03795 [Burkholderiales bacterium]|nr:hypothetical protein [Burkholderiales bacterium]